MSDTTITPEERALWASVATARINAVTPERQCEITAQERLVNALKALEQAEARAEQAEARVKSRNNHIHRLLGEALESERNLDGMKSRLQEAEARAEKAEKELAGADAEITELRDELEDSRGTEKDAQNIMCAIARLVGVYEHCQALGDDMGEMTLDTVRDLLAEKQTAEAENTRLTKMVDWLANKLIDCPPEFTNCAVDCAECRKEAASRSVAAGEEPCQK